MKQYSIYSRLKYLSILLKVVKDCRGNSNQKILKIIIRYVLNESCFALIIQSCLSFQQCLFKLARMFKRADQMTTFNQQLFKSLMIELVFITHSNSALSMTTNLQLPFSSNFLNRIVSTKTPLIFCGSVFITLNFRMSLTQRFILGPAQGNLPKINLF